MNIYQLLGTLTAIEKLPEGVLSVKRDSFGAWRMQLARAEFLACFPSYEHESFDPKSYRLTFKGEGVTVFCLIPKLSEVA